MPAPTRAHARLLAHLLLRQTSLESLTPAASYLRDASMRFEMLMDATEDAREHWNQIADLQNDVAYQAEGSRACMLGMSDDLVQGPIEALCDEAVLQALQFLDVRLLAGEQMMAARIAPAVDPAQQHLSLQQDRLCRYGVWLLFDDVLCKMVSHTHDCRLRLDVKQIAFEVSSGAPAPTIRRLEIALGPGGQRLHAFSGYGRVNSVVLHAILTACPPVGVLVPYLQDVRLERRIEAEHEVSIMG
jgi:hypothetical protein